MRCVFERAGLRVVPGLGKAAGAAGFDGIVARVRHASDALGVIGLALGYSERDSGAVARNGKCGALARIGGDRRACAFGGCGRCGGEQRIEPDEQRASARRTFGRGERGTVGGAGLETPQLREAGERAAYWPNSLVSRATVASKRAGSSSSCARKAVTSSARAIAASSSASCPGLYAPIASRSRLSSASAK